jgi:hypothetical protein
MTQTVLGLPLNPIDSVTQRIAFTNLFNNYLGQPLYMPNGMNRDGTISCPDGTLHPVSAINYLHNKRDIIEKSAQQRPLIRLADKNLRIVGELAGELSLEFEELMSDSGTARYVVRYDNWLVDYMVNLTRIEEDLHLIIDPNPLKPTWRTRWGGKIHTLNIARHEDGTSTVELLAISNREHAKKLLFAANPFSPPEIQLPKMWIMPGPTRTALFMSCFVNLARLFVPGLSFITNIFNPASWVNPLNADSLFNVDPLSWPIQCAFVNPLTDTSRWTVLGATWTSWFDATQDILKDSGVMMRAYTWLTEDEDSPYDELTNLFGISKNPDIATAAARPTRNCVIFRFEDKSGHQGPTGTAIDGLLNLIGVTLDDLLSSTLINAETGLALDGEPVVDVQGNSIPIFESLLGVAPEVPKVIWREGQFTGLIEATHTLNKAAPRTIMTGGRSPSLVNQLQTFGIRYGLSQLSDMINVGLGTIFNTAFQMPGTPGLDNLYQGQLDNSLFAWERLTDPFRALVGGELDLQEHFERGSSTAYTLSGILTLRTGMWKTRPFQGFKAKVYNGKPWTIDEDTVLGDRNGFEFDAVIYVDQITGVKRAVDRKKPLLAQLTIGEDKDKFDPMARTMRAVQAVYTLLGTFVGEGTLFG